ncbi:MAG: HNH/ENDO VII family nuclease, partial [Lachnospiraceae bacterium]|nr:HNH/ENDO VII family nuclease [Lachnospiraceae bacterium]
TTDKVTEWTGSEALGIIAGMGTSSLSYGGLSAVDYKVNISGLHGTGGNTRIGNVTGSGKSGSGSIGEGIESGSKADTKPYTNSRPSFRKGVVEEVWENAKGPDGLVRDPNTGEVINWTPGESRKGVWDMGHIPEAKYSEMHEAYMNGELTTKEFVDWYNDPANYRPELPSNNRSHKYE